MALIWLQGLELDISEQTNKNKDFDFVIFDSKMAKLIKKWVNMFQMIVIFTLESKIGFINLGFGTYYDHCEVAGSQNVSTWKQASWQICKPLRYSFQGFAKMNTNRLLDRPYVNLIILRRQNLS